MSIPLTDAALRFEQETGADLPVSYSQLKRLSYARRIPARRDERGTWVIPENDWLRFREIMLGVASAHKATVVASCRP